MASALMEQAAEQQGGLLALPVSRVSQSVGRRRLDAMVSAVHGLVLFATVAAASAIRPAAIPLVTGVLVTLIWLLALTVVYRSPWFSTRALGTPASTALGTAIGLAGNSALGFWVPAMGLQPASLLWTSVCVFVASIAFVRVLASRLVLPQRVLILGCGKEARDLVLELDDETAPFECVGMVSARGDDVAGAERLLLGETAELGWILAVERPDIVVLANDRATEALPKLLDNASAGFRVVGLAHFYEYAFGRVPITHLPPVWFLSILHLNQRPYSRVAKRSFDIILAAAGLLICAPILPLVALLVRRSGPGPVLLRQTRLGEGGKTFEMLKFRTMTDAAEEPGTAVWAAAEDPRVTSVGRRLRHMRLDEVPQLLNVLRGEMSIVGPRPERPEFLGLLAAEVPFWTRRHLIKPGITGWAQIRSGYTSDVVGTAEKLSYDLFYIKHRSLVLDLAIALMTARTVISGAGAR
jgi:exopolysaccharide biosynthesis polyprenyl glycosylphosphotransferase